MEVPILFGHRIFKVMVLSAENTTVWH